MATLINILLTPIVVMLIGLLGYFTGVIVAYVPFFNDLFVAGLGLQYSAIPTIMAWLFVLAVLINLYNTRSGE